MHFCNNESTNAMIRDTISFAAEIDDFDFNELTKNCLQCILV